MEQNIGAKLSHAFSGVVDMVRIIAALAVCYLAGTTAGRGFLPYSVGLPAGNFKSDIDALAASGAGAADPEKIKAAVTIYALDASRRTTNVLGLHR